MQDWWQRRRYGVLIQASLSTVPAWAPIGESATWYRAQLGQAVSDTLLHQSPMVETLDHHARVWPGISDYEDFVDLLRFESFDADEWAQFALDAGMGYVAMTAKHYDGWCWWPAPNTNRRLTEKGPRRDVFGEFADACRRRDLAFGAEYALLDWADERYPTAQYVDQVIHAQLVDLVRNYDIDLLRGAGHWGAGGDHWRSDELFEKLLRLRPDLNFNNRFWATNPGILSINFLTPWFEADGEWEMTRGVGNGSGYNQAEPLDRLLSPAEIVSLLTEVVARGGHLQIALGPDASGQLPTDQVARLTTAGEWIHRHHDIIHRSSPRLVWGGNGVRYLDLDDRVVAINTESIGHRRVRFAELTHHGCPAVKITDDHEVPVDFVQTDAGIVIERTTPSSVDDLVDVFYITVDREQATPIRLFSDLAPAHTDLSDVLSDAVAGEVIQLGEGTYSGPARIPDGVTVRGLGADRTALFGGHEPAVVLGSGARLEHCRVVGGRRIAWLPKTSVLVGGRDAGLLACRVDGHIDIDNARQIKVTSCELSGVVVLNSDEVSIVRSTFVGMGWDCAVDITGGSGHLIDSNELEGALQAVRLTGTVGTVVRNNTVRSRWWGVHMVDTDATEVVANKFDRTMRAIDVDGGIDNRVSGNAAIDGDSGCLLQRGAANTEISGNRWERVRIGILAWDAGTYRAEDNSTVDVADIDERVGP